VHPLVGLQLSGNTLTPLDDVAHGEGHLGRPIWNARQLLGDLELRLGLPRQPLGRGLRVQQWSKRLAALVTEPGSSPYFAAAYAADPTGTAAQLLRLRDELVDAGWNGDSLAGAERLETLSRLTALDGPALPPGMADQLVAVEAELGRVTSTPYVAFDLVDDPELWPGRWRRVFQRLQFLGTRFARVQPAWPSSTDDSDLSRFQRALRGVRSQEARPAARDGSLVLLRGATSSLLAEPTAALLAADRTPTVVIRGLDPVALDDALELQGLARQGVVSSSRWRPALQVLRLALAVAFVPRDPRRVLELLTLTGGPFAGRAGHRLADAWCDRPGTGNALWAEATAELSEEERERVQLWIESPQLDPLGTPRELLLEVAERALSWGTGRASWLRDPSWHAATLQAQAFVDALRTDARERLDRPAVEQLLQDLTDESSSVAIAREEAGRIDHVDSPERLLVPRERVVWWGFVGESPPPRPLFRAAELDLLRRAGFALPDPLARLRARFQGFVGAVHAARRQLVLVIPEQVAGERCAPHPLLDELVARVLGSEKALAALSLSPEDLARGEGLAASLVRVATQAAPVIPLPAARRQWHVDPSLIRPREAESASSLEKLIGCPLAWTLHYQAGLRSASRRGIPSGPLLAGKLGHRLIEELHLAGGLTGTPDDVRQAAEGALDLLIEREGTPLLIAGASDARHQLRAELVNAAVALAALLREAQLELMGVEVPVVAELGGRPLRGRIDVLLKAANGDERVLDLKYGSGSYSAKLKAGHAIQLAVYAEARRQQSGAAEPPPAAYFSLKNQRLLATDAAAHFGRQPQPGPALSKTGEQIRNTVGAIAATLEAGRIPVAGVKETAEAGFLKMLGVTNERSPDHLTLLAKDTCQYCELGAVCGRSWEQPW
jgi:ATP-dependent helicase/nuclease subunit B